MIAIYALFDTDTHSPFYVGATKHATKRFRQHQNYTVKKIEGVVLEECELEDARFLEEFYIDMFRYYGFLLTNSKRCAPYGKRFYDGKIKTIRKDHDGKRSITWEWENKVGVVFGCRFEAPVVHFNESEALKELEKEYKEVMSKYSDYFK